MSAQFAPTFTLHRLDKALFWLRWLFWGGMILLAALGNSNFEQPLLSIGLGFGAGANILLGLATLSPRVGQQTLTLLNTLLDSLLAVTFFYIFQGHVAPLLAFGTLAIMVSAFRKGWFGHFVALLLVTGGSLLAISQFAPYDEWANWGLRIAFLFTVGVLSVIFRSGGLSLGGASQGSGDEREYEARQLRATRERAQAIFDMATALSASLDHQQVLTEAQNIGMLGLRDQLGNDGRLVSAVMLFQGEDNQLSLITSRGLTRQDQAVTLPGRKGVLGLAIKQAEPVFSGDPARDPELRYFVAFQTVKSVLVIPLRAGIDVYGVMIFGCDLPNAFSDDHVELMTAIGTQSTLSLQNAVLYQNLKSEKEKIVAVEEDARKKLSRDLHDGPTQSVAAIAMRVNYIRRLIERQPQQAIEELWKIEDLARRTTKEIRHMLFTLRPLVLETQGLLAALAQLAEKMHDTHDCSVVLKALPDVEHYLDMNAQGVLFYVIEEAVNNARKHAQSEHIWVRLYHRDQQFVVVEIEDDGIGFDVGAVDSSYDQRGSLGMVNMRERAELIEGTVRIHSAPERGTKITVVIPVHAVGRVDEMEEDAEPLAPLTMQSHRAGIHTPAAPSEKQPEAQPAVSSAPPPPPVSTPSTSSRPTSPTPPWRSGKSDQPSSFAKGGVEQPANAPSPTPDSQQSSAPHTASEFGQLFDSFANGGVAKPDSPAGKENSFPIETDQSAPQTPQTPRRRSSPPAKISRPKRPQTTSRPRSNESPAPEQKKPPAAET